MLLFLVLSCVLVRGASSDSRHGFCGSMYWALVGSLVLWTQMETDTPQNTKWGGLEGYLSLRKTVLSDDTHRPETALSRELQYLLGSLDKSLHLGVTVRGRGQWDPQCHHWRKADNQQGIRSLPNQWGNAPRFSPDNWVVSQNIVGNPLFLKFILLSCFASWLQQSRPLLYPVLTSILTTPPRAVLPWISTKHGRSSFQ